MDSSSEQKSKVLMIGIDGMDYSMISQLMSEGKLPNFQKLSDLGSSGSLKTSMPPHSPVAWTSIATGKNPGKTNIFDFIRREPGSYMPELSLAKTKSSISGTDYVSYVAADPFWRITSDKKIPTTVIRWPVSFPAERVEGNLLPGLGIPDIKGFLSGYSYYTEEKPSSDDKSASKTVVVSIEDNKISTIISGPKTRKDNDIIDITSSFKITLNKDESTATLNVGGKDILVSEGSWSDWLQINFKVSLFKKISGVAKAYVVSLDPFKMYLTTIQIDPDKPFMPITYPESYSKDLVKEFDSPYYTLGMPEETDGYVDGKLDANAFLDQTYEIDDERMKMFNFEFEKFKKRDSGIFAFVFDTSDRITHVFWNHSYLENPEGKIQISKEVEDYYIKKDLFIGRVMNEIQDDTFLLVFSDHGFSSFEKSVSINSWLAQNDFLTLRQEIPDGEDGALFRYVDWSSSKAYSVGFNSIYINKVGRESKGIVVDDDVVINDIIEKLENLTDSETGKFVINKVYKSKEIYSGDSVVNASDLVIGFNPGYRMAWQTAIGGFSKEIIENNTKVWAGDHLIDSTFVPGILFSNKNLNFEDASITDIIPTMFNYLEIDGDYDFDGKSLI